MSRPFNKLSVPLTILSIAVIGILIIGSLGYYIFENTKIIRVHQDFPELSKVVEEYRAVTGAYPTTEQGLRALVDRPKPSPPHWKRILDTVPIDAWGNRYRYRLASREGKEVPEFYSCGKDGVPDTEDDLSSLDAK